MRCSRIRLPDGAAGFACRRGRRGGKRAAAAAVEPPPALPLEGGGETERARLTRLLACVEREAGKRRTFYPRWIAEGRLPEAAAQRELDAWADVWAELAAALRGQPPGRSAADAARCTRLVATVAREVERRTRAYPRQVAFGRMKKATAEREQAEMREVLDLLTDRRRMTE